MISNYKITLFVIIILFIFMIYKCKQKEQFVPQMFFSETTSKFIDQYKTYSEESEISQEDESTMYPHSDNHNKPLASAQSTSPITHDADLFHDPLMSDVTYFPNDAKTNGELGIIKCLKQCKNGSCVEYGVTGNAHCFPYKS